MKSLLTLICCIMQVMALSGHPSDNPDNRTARPSMILFIADDLGYGELGCQSNPLIPTPFSDAISQNGKASFRLCLFPEWDWEEGFILCLHL
jgi:arylsulfatase A